jgi:hypothetical protein
VRSLASRAINCDLSSALVPWCCTTRRAGASCSRSAHTTRCVATRGVTARRGP